MLWHLFGVFPIQHANKSDYVVLDVVFAFKHIYGNSILEKGPKQGDFIGLTDNVFRNSMLSCYNKIAIF